ncbi:MAG: hypothetical protein QXQ87_08155, partial [Halobacteria archaeon]
MGRKPAAQNREYSPSSRLSGPLPGLLLCLGLIAAVPVASAQLYVEQLLPGIAPSPAPSPAIPAPAPSGTMVTFNDSFADESKVASREGLVIFHGNVTLAGRVGNPGFEGEGEWSLRTRGNYTGAIQSLWASEGIRSFRLSAPASQARTAGDFAELVQAANFTGATELRFVYRTSPRAPYHVLSVAVAGPNRTPPLPGTTLWSRTFDPADRSLFRNESVSVPVPGSFQGTLDLVFRLETTANFSASSGAANASGNTTSNASATTGIGVEIDDVRLLPESMRSRGLLTSAPVETAPIVSASGAVNATGPVGLQVSNDDGATWESVTWGQPVWFASSGRSFRYRLELRPYLPAGNNTTAPLSPEVYDVRFALETSPADFSVRLPGSAKAGEAVHVRVEPDGMRYFFLALAPNGLPLNLTRNATSFSFTPAMSGTYLIDIRAVTLPGAATPANISKRLFLQVSPGTAPTPPPQPPSVEVGAGAVLIRVHATPGAADYPVEIHYWVESGAESVSQPVQKLSPGVVGGRVQPGGSTEFQIGIANLEVGPGSYRFAARVATPDGAHDLKAPLTIAGIAGQTFPLFPAAAAGGAAAGGGFVFYRFFRRKRRAKPAGGEAFDAAAAQASMEAAAADVALPSDTSYVEDPPPFVGTPPTRLARIAEAEMPPPPVVQDEIPDWTPPAPPPEEPEFPAAAGDGLGALLQEKESISRELKELESYSQTLGGSKSAEEVRQALEGRREMRSKLRAALEAVESRIRALQGGGAPAPQPGPARVPAPPP